MKIERVDVDAIDIAKDRRKTNPETVRALIESMRMLGQLQPIVLYDDGKTGRLIAGRHRLEAAQFLGWDFIDAVFIDGDAIDLRLHEITENLHRAELTVQERSEQITEWAELVEQRASLLRQVDAKTKGRPEGGTRKAARDLGLTEPDLRRAKKIASMTPEAKEAAREVGIDDNQSKLLKVADAPPEQQVAKVHSLAQKLEERNERRTEREEWLLKGKKWWLSGRPEWRGEFLAAADKNGIAA